MEEVGGVSEAAAAAAGAGVAEKDKDAVPPLREAGDEAVETEWWDEAFLTREMRDEEVRYLPSQLRQLRMTLHTSELFFLLLGFLTGVRIGWEQTRGPSSILLLPPCPPLRHMPAPEV